MTIRAFSIQIALVALAATAHVLAEPVGTAFTFQGRLDVNGKPAEGVFDLEISLYDVPDGGNPVAPPVQLPAQPIKGGVFSAELDFGGAERFDGTGYWLGVRVTKDGAGNPEEVPGRIAIRPSPYALHALSAAAVANGAIDSASLADGAVTQSKLSPGAVGIEQFSVAGPPAAGQVLGFDGADLTWLTPPSGGGGGGPWLTNGSSAYYTAGNVGVGTASPAGKLHVDTNWDGDMGANIRLTGSKPSVLWSQRVFGVGSRHWLGHMDTDGNFGYYRRSTTLGDVGLPPSDTGWQLKFNINADSGDINAAGGVNYGGRLGKLDTAEVFAATVRSADFLLGHSARRGAPGRALVDWNDGAGTNALVLNWANDWPETHIGGAVTQVTTLRIIGGADLAEPFPISGDDVPPGAVVVIDEANPGTLRVSGMAYDPKVAGIVSGADGIQPGISMIQKDQLEAGKNVALSGRVYVKANTVSGPIAPGDMLTTSDVPGEAMKATDRVRAQGAVLGKAMTRLDDGSGTVLVLVTLQ